MDILMRFPLALDEVGEQIKVGFRKPEYDDR